MQVIDINYLISFNFHKNTNPVHDLKINFDKILSIVKLTLADQLDTFGNLHRYPNRPSLPDPPYYHPVAASGILEYRQ